MALTDNQKKAVESRGVNILVSASAGSGKTTAMVSRIVSLISEGASLEKMLIITFTKAAASDMRDKIGKAIIEMRDKDERFDRELRILPSAKIGTIDSWCGATVKNYFYAVDTDADYDLIGDGEKHALCDAAVDALVTESIENDPDFREIYESFVVNRRDGMFKNFIYDVIEFAKTRVDPYEWLAHAADSYGNDSIAREVENYYKKKADRALSELENLKECAVAVKYEKLAVHCDDIYSDFLNERKFTSFYGSDKDYPDLNDRASEIKVKLKKLSELKAQRQKYGDMTAIGKQVKAAADFSARVYDYLQKDRKRRAVADYGDLEHAALDILRSDVGDEIRSECEYVFVDEYQDVNPLQDALIRAAVGKYLFIVGDVKQSIYAFRMSDPDIFLEKMNEPESNGFEKSIEFSENFRSGTAVIDYANAVFSRAMTVSFGGVDYEKSKLIFGKKEDGGEVKLRLLSVPKKSKEERFSGVYDIKNHRIESDEGVRAMATYIARGIAERLETPDENGNRVRERDIAVLFRSSEEVTALVYDTLKNSGINVYLCRNNYFSSAKESRVVNQFLSLLTFSEDDVNMLGYLLSPLCDLSESDLCEAMNGRRDGLCKNVREYARTHDGAVAEKLRVALDRINRYVAYSRKMSVPELVAGLIAETDYDVKLLASPEGEAAAETLVRFTEYLSSLKSASNVVDYVRYLQDGDGKYQAPAPSGCLKMMTVHTSKGLQFPYVFLINCDRKFNDSDEKKRYFCDDKYGLCVKSGKKDNYENNYLTENAKLRLSKKRREEELRLLYVAMTRAEKGLYAYAFDKEKKNVEPEDADCFLDWLMPASDGIVEYADQSLIDAEERKDREADSASAEDDECLTEMLRKRIDFVPPRTPREIKTTVTRIAGEESTSSVIVLPDDEAMMKKGTAYHAIMQKIDFFAPFESEYERLKTYFTPEISVGEIKAAHRSVGEIVRAFGGKQYREQSFVVDMNGTLVQGIIDLLLINGNDALILDYKLSGAKNLLSDKYVRQIGAYAAAAEKVLKVKVSEAVLYSFTSKEAKKVERADFRFDFIQNDGKI